MRDVKGIGPLHIYYRELSPVLRGVTGVVDAGLDDVIQGEPAGRLLVPQVAVHFGREHLGHVVVVLAEVGVLLLRRVVHLQLVVSVSERHADVRAADLEPVRHPTNTIIQKAASRTTSETHTHTPVFFS